jgi:acyl carrier protein
MDIDRRVMDRPAAREKLVAFLATIARPGLSVEGVDEQEDLVRSGLIDSLAVLEIIGFLEREYGLDFSSRGIDPADLSSIGRVLETIERGSP